MNERAEGGLLDIRVGVGRAGFRLSVVAEADLAVVPQTRWRHSLASWDHLGILGGRKCGMAMPGEEVLVEPRERCRAVATPWP